MQRDKNEVGGYLILMVSDVVDDDAYDGHTKTVPIVSTTAQPIGHESFR